MPDEYNDLRARIDRIAEDVAGIKTLLQTEPQRCIYREQIARAVNGIEERKALAARVDRLEQAIHRLDLSITKIVAIVLASGGIGAATGKLLERLL